MQVARISMSEYITVEALDQFIEDYSKDFWEIFSKCNKCIDNSHWINFDH